MNCDEVKQFLSAAYARITGRPCKADISVVRKESAFGFYYVHLLETGYFYEAKWKLQ